MNAYDAMKTLSDIKDVAAELRNLSVVINRDSKLHDSLSKECCVNASVTARLEYAATLLVEYSRVLDDAMRKTKLEV